MAKFKLEGPDGGTYVVEAESAQVAHDTLYSDTKLPGAGASPWDTVRDTALGFGRGLVEGAAALPGVPGTLLGGAQKAGDWLGDRVGDAIFGAQTSDQAATTAKQREDLRSWTPALPTSTDTINAVDTATGGTLKYEPKTSWGQAARTFGQFAAPAGIIGGAGKAASGAERIVGTVESMLSPTAVLAPATATEVAGKLTEGKPYEGFARLAAGLLTGGVGGLVRAPSTADQVLARNLPKVLTPTDVAAAETLMQNAGRSGVKLTWPEAIAQVTNGRASMADVQRWVENTRGGKDIMTPFMAERPGQITAATTNQMDALTSGATLQPPVQAGLAIQGAAKDAIGNLRDNINKLTEADYRTAGPVQVDPKIFAAMSQDPLFVKALAEVRNEPSYARLVGGKPDDSIDVLNVVKQWLDKGAEPVIGGPNTRAASFRDVAGDVRNAATAASPEYARALATQKALRDSTLGPLEAGPLGKAAATEDLNAQGKALLPSAPSAGGASTTAQTVQRLVRQNPDAAFQLVRNHLETTFAEQTQAGSSGANQFGGAKWNAFIRGNSEQAKNLEAAIKALPNGQTRWVALNAFFDTLEATGQRAPAGASTTFNQLMSEDMKFGGKLGEIASRAGSPFSLKTLSVVRDFYERYRMGAASADLARIFTDPNAGPLILNLVKAKGTPNAFNATVALITGIEANQAQEGRAQ